MKAILLVLFASLLSHDGNDLNTKPSKTCYYFCTSRTIKHAQNDSKDVLLYTDVYTILGDESAIESKSADWKNFVDKNCKSKCTSDLNYYPSFEEAVQNLKESLEIFKAKPNYEIKKVEL